MSILPRNSWKTLSRCFSCCQENCAYGPCTCDCHRCKACGAVYDHYCPGLGERLGEFLDAIKPVRCKTHPRYRGAGKPRLPCEACWRIYIKEHP